MLVFAHSQPYLPSYSTLVLFKKCELRLDYKIENTQCPGPNFQSYHLYTTHTLHSPHTATLNKHQHLYITTSLATYLMLLSNPRSRGLRTTHSYNNSSKQSNKKQMGYLDIDIQQTTKTTKLNQAPPHSTSKVKEMGDMNGVEENETNHKAMGNIEPNTLYLTFNAPKVDDYVCTSFTLFLFSVLSFLYVYIFGGENTDIYTAPRTLPHLPTPLLGHHHKRYPLPRNLQRVL